ncbi:hypothetical protein RUM44_005982 [Polyplax serrata]|uniref:DUF4795 domain-containing protein n=1 Tax=Polyplax serrata TaxID=468196 RepID=A0ABR1AZA9_POLSC
MIDTGDGKPCPSRSKTSKPDMENTDTDKESTGQKKPPCQCQEKKKKPDDEREKSEKEKLEKEKPEKDKFEKTKSESEGEEKRKEEKEMKKDLNQKDCEEEDEPEPKKLREFKKPCPCKGKDTTPIIDEDVRAAASSYYGSDSEGNCQTIVRVEPVGERCDSWRSRPALAHESMVRLEEKVAMLQDAFEALEQLPTNEELKKKAQGSASSATPVKDLWQLYNLNKRVESCEGTVEKMASMIEDLVKETCNLKEAMLVVADAVDEMECADQLGKTTCFTAIPGQTNNPFATTQTSAEPTKKPGVSFQGEGQSGGTRCNGGPCTEDDGKRTASGSRVPEQGGENQQEGQEPRTEEAGNALGAQDGGLGADIDGAPEQRVGIGPEFYKMSAAQKFCILKENVNCLIFQIKQMNENLPVSQIASKLCALVSMQRQLDALEKEWRAFLETFGEEGIMGLHNTIEEFRIEFENIHNLISKLIAEKQDIEATIRTIQMEIEHIKRVKADLEIVEDLLAEKADASVVNRKVSHDQFDAACDDLTRGLDETLDRLMQQEALWNEAMEELQKGMDNKLDKNEIMPLKEFINKKLKCLQEKLKQLAQLRKDAEAAGAKSRILRNLNCIACDGDVVMKMDNAASYQCPPMAPPKGIKPMLTYELDQVRRAMKKGPCRATNHVEEVIADTQKKITGIPLTQKEAVDSKVSKLAHFCNRYCGGSHTITTPQQRVTRIGHFLTEFGPQAMSMFNQDNFDSRNPLCPPTVAVDESDIQKPCV